MPRSIALPALPAPHVKPARRSGSYTWRPQAQPINPAQYVLGASEVLIGADGNPISENGQPVVYAPGPMLPAPVETGTVILMGD